MTVVTALKLLSGLAIVYTLFLQIKSLQELRSTEEGRAKIEKDKAHAVYNGIVAFVVNFFDVFGIGSYATATAAYKFKRSVDDIDIPGILNIGDTVPVAVEAICFFSLVDIELTTLIPMLVSMVLGARLGAGIVTKWDAHRIRLALGLGLIAVGIIMTCKQLGFGPFGLVGTANGIHGVKLVVAVICVFIFGALMNIGVGAYALTFALVSLMGMNVQSAFPIMMGGCTFLMAFGAGPKLLKEKRYNVIATWENTILGTIGALIAYFLIKSIPTTVLLWIVVVVVFITSATFLHDYAKDNRPSE